MVLDSRKYTSDFLSGNYWKFYKKNIEIIRKVLK